MRIFLFIMGLVLFAEAKEVSQYINLGINDSEIYQKKGNGFDFSWGAKAIWNNHITASYELTYQQGKIDKAFYCYGANIKLGYQYQDFSLYGIGSALGQTYITTGYGFGYGVGTEYIPWKHFGFGVDFISYHMTSEEGSYDYKTGKAYLKILY